MSDKAPQIREHVEVVGSDGGHAGMVDRAEGDRITLTTRDDPDRSGRHHHFLPVSSIASVSGDQVRLDMPAARARALATMTGGTSPRPALAA